MTFVNVRGCGQYLIVGQVNVPEGRAVVSRDLGRLEKRVVGNLLKFSKGK